MKEGHVKLICEELSDSSMLRETLLKELEIKENDPLNAPGSYSCHELLHTTSIAMAGIDDFLLNHPACVSNPHWFSLAHFAMSSLHSLYQSIGAEHLPKIGEQK